MMTEIVRHRTEVLAKQVDLVVGEGPTGSINSSVCLGLLFWVMGLGRKANHRKRYCTC